MSESIVYNMDCMEYMKTLPDKAFDLAIVDPPYGDGNANIGGGRRFGQRFDRYKMPQSQQLHESGFKAEKGTSPEGRTTGFLDMPSGESGGIERTGGTWAAKYGKKIVAWDVAPPQEYFNELFRVSKNQVIWGGNYFRLPPTRCFLVWRKLTISESFTMAMAEYAWTSFNGNAKVFEKAPQAAKDEQRFHPTQKPVELYEWILALYGKKGDRVLDTHLGSGSSRIACAELGYDFVGCEIDKTYFDLQEKRYKEYSDQLRLF